MEGGSDEVITFNKPKTHDMFFPTNSTDQIQESMANESTDMQRRNQMRPMDVAKYGEKYGKKRTFHEFDSFDHGGGIISQEPLQRTASHAQFEDAKGDDLSSIGEKDKD